MELPRGNKGSLIASRRRILERLLSERSAQTDSELDRFTPMQVINSLFSFLYHVDTSIKRKAVSMMGATVAELAEDDMESGRNVIRRLMWNLNDESGSIGWGSPEAMGEIMARHEKLAMEYGHILASYTLPEGNYLENEIIQRGLLWALLRVYRTRPELFRRLNPLLLPYLESCDPAVRGLAAELLGEIREEKAYHSLSGLLEDGAEFENEMEGTTRTVKQAAQEALAKIGNQ
ncbi:MAG: HEAT repeat domain-containing protein [Desulfobacteraceae bacterium]|nr:MAG: HEAT repeat domain-containing protein [Desulfobacteraceae bacterium]